MGIAGIWSCWKSPKREVLSYSMRTINADHHALMRHFHRQQKERRMVLVVPEDSYTDGLHPSAQENRGFLLPYPAEALRATAPAQTQASLFG